MTEAALDLPHPVHVERCMGTVFSIDIRDPGDWSPALGAVVAWLHRVDAVFSTYQPGSDISRLRRGHLDVTDADPLVAEVLGLCTELQSATDGYFSPYWDGALDPTGLVKGWAIERASGLLLAHGSQQHAVNGGGDVRVVGGAAAGQPWRIGVADPFERSRVLTVVRGRDIAVATSGVAERGAHIMNPLTGAPATELASVTVVGNELTRSDAYATAAFAMGTHALSWLEDLRGHEALVVDADGTVRCTSGFGPASPRRRRRGIEPP